MARILAKLVDGRIGLPVEVDKIEFLVYRVISQIGGLLEPFFTLITLRIDHADDVYLAEIRLRVDRWFRLHLA